MSVGNGHRHGKASSQPSLKLPGLSEILRPAEVLLVVPPFAELSRPSLGVHLLQACGQKAGFRVHLLYANLLLARLIGEKAYDQICSPPTDCFVGERFFAHCAYGVARLGRNSSKMFDWTWTITGAVDDGPAIEPGFSGETQIGVKELRRLESSARQFINTLAQAIVPLSYKIVGCSSCFEQTSASVALLNRIKFLNQDTVTILGGANCEGEMARGIAALSPSIDYIFSGESEIAFVEFVSNVLRGSFPSKRIIRGVPFADMDALPTPSFAQFFEQRDRLLRHPCFSRNDTEIPYETSRGCWWAQQHRCTYCGLTGENVIFRQKAPARVIEELRELLQSSPTRKVAMTDNVMPHGYFKSLLPRMAGELPPHSIFYEQRPNLSLRHILALKDAGITSIQPGIEALSSRLLRLIGKGVEAWQNLMLLRHARAAGIQVWWNLLWGFPGDQMEAYEETLGIIPLLHHLPPPEVLCHVMIERFSPYFSDPARFGIRRMQPITPYYDFLPRKADVRRIAYHFTADYKSGAHDGLALIRELRGEVQQWHAAWGNDHNWPIEDLRIRKDHNRYLLVDTRQHTEKKRILVLSETEASALLAAKPYIASRAQLSAVEAKLAIVLDGWFVPLAVAEPKILVALEQPAPPATADLKCAA